MEHTYSKSTSGNLSLILPLVEAWSDPSLALVDDPLSSLCVIRFASVLSAFMPSSSLAPPSEGKSEGQKAMISVASFFVSRHQGEEELQGRR